MARQEFGMVGVDVVWTEGAGQQNHRVAMARLKPLGESELLVAAVYLQDGVGMSTGNLHILGATFATASKYGLPLVVAAD